MPRKARILVVNRDRSKLRHTMAFLAGQNYEPCGSTCLHELNELIGLTGELALAILHISGLEHELESICGLLESQKIPFLVISPRRINILSERLLRDRARGIIMRHPADAELQGYINSLLVVH